jgi:hypothetical protein
LLGTNHLPFPAYIRFKLHVDPQNAKQRHKTLRPHLMTSPAPNNKFGASERQNTLLKVNRVAIPTPPVMGVAALFTFKRRWIVNFVMTRFSINHSSIEKKTHNGFIKATATSRSSVLKRCKIVLRQSGS